MTCGNVEQVLVVLVSVTLFLVHRCFRHQLLCQDVLCPKLRTMPTVWELHLGLSASVHQVVDGACIVVGNVGCCIVKAHLLLLWSNDHSVCVCQVLLV